MNAASVRPFSLSDLGTAAELCDRARKRDASVEPFGQRLALLATGPRARVNLWRIAEDEEGAAQGIAFASLRQPRSGSAPAVLDMYALVAPDLRRQRLGRALCAALLAAPAALRARVREDSAAGRAFLLALGFVETSAQLSLAWSARPLKTRATPALRVRAARQEDAPIVELLSREAWADSADAFATRADEVAQLLAGAERLALLAEMDGRPIGYLSGVWLDRTLGIEEVAVLPDFRRAGVACALVAEALRGASHAVLSVVESNRAARALYRSFGFAPASRRIVYERSR